MPATKRSEGEIIQDIARVYSHLSPENLTWDGERQEHGRGGWRAEYRRLNAKLKELFKELGREVSEADAFRQAFKARCTVP